MPRPEIQLDYATRKLKPRPHDPSTCQDVIAYITYVGVALAASLIVASFCVIGYLIWAL
jgi:hypothetical protein